MDVLMKTAVVLFSGGLDSTTCLAYAKAQGFNCHAISFSYGQRHSSELLAAIRIAKQMGVSHHLVELPIAQLGGSALTDATLNVPDYSGASSIPVTYVPARNTIFLSFALAWAEVLKADDIFIGVSSVDYSGYPDCRPDYIAAFQALALLATKTGVEDSKVKIHTPVMHLSKADTIHLGVSLGVDYSLTVSCYKASDDGKACGMCDSCALRKKGFKDALVLDPTSYQSS
jgi:7-cyano-7-deazaguanine synthase